MFIPESKIDEWVAEDVPYIDLTTHLLHIGDQLGRMSFFTRQQAILCATEEVCRVLSKHGITVMESKPTGSRVEQGEVFLTARGRAEDLNRVAKVCQNLFDRCSGVASLAGRLVEKAKAVNPDIQVVGTRKGFPGTKSLMTKAILAGGMYPHRLGLSETILIFKQHTLFLGGMDVLLKTIPQLQKAAFEKKVIVEAETPEDCLRLCKAGVDGVQIEKFTPEVLAEVVCEMRKINPKVVAMAAGGVAEHNIDAYAATGVDGIVTTSVYNANPIDIGVRITPLGQENA